MTAIEFHEDGIQIDAGMLGEGLGLEPGSVPDLLRQGAITSRCERCDRRGRERCRLCRWR